MARMKTGIPTTKVLGATLGGAAATLIIYLIEAEIGLSHPLPDAVEAALTTLVVFVVGYVVPPSERDQIVTT